MVAVYRVGLQVVHVLCRVLAVHVLVVHDERKLQVYKDKTLSADCFSICMYSSTSTLYVCICICMHKMYVCICVVC